MMDSELVALLDHCHRIVAEQKHAVSKFHLANPTHSATIKVPMSLWLRVWVKRSHLPGWNTAVLERDLVFLRGQSTIRVPAQLVIDVLRPRLGAAPKKMVAGKATRYAPSVSIRPTAEQGVKNIKEVCSLQVRNITPWPSYNRVCCGPGLHLIAAPVGDGKTTLARQIVAHLAEQHNPVVLYDNDYASWRMLQRNFGVHARVATDLHDVNEELRVVYSACQQTDDRYVIIDPLTLDWFNESHEDLYELKRSIARFNLTVIAFRALQSPRRNAEVTDMFARLPLPLVEVADSITFMTRSTLGMQMWSAKTQHASTEHFWLVQSAADNFIFVEGAPRLHRAPSSGWVEY
jgi:hypothetical protein